MPTLTIDGQEVVVAAGTNLIEAAKQVGITVPHYCYHPALNVVASCRMCFVEVTQEVRGKPRTGLVVACNTAAADGMIVSTTSDAVKNAQGDILEFLLINHPVDCPVCDKAGECKLQDYTFEYGLPSGRMTEPKRFKPVKHLGSGIRLYTNRCILCDRCVRFLRDFVGTGELTIRNIGNANEVDIMPGHPIDNPLAANIVDLCPVGALLTEDFLFKSRVWNHKPKPSIDPSDSLGSNTILDIMNNEVQRVRPRENLDVNGYFITDEARYIYKTIRSEKRLVTPVQPDPETDDLLEAPWEAALVFIDEKMRAANSNAIILVSTHVTQEELAAVKEYASIIGTDRIAHIPNAFVTEDQSFPGGFVIPADKSPNTRGVTAEVPTSIDDIAIDNASIMLVVNSSIRIENIAEPHLSKILGADFVFAIDVLKSPLVERAFISLPGRMWAEKSGTWVNYNGIAQEFRPALNGPLDSRAEADILRDLIQRAVNPKPNHVLSGNVTTK